METRSSQVIEHSYVGQDILINPENFSPEVDNSFDFGKIVVK